jgi:uncharacterized membrane protein
MVKVILLLLALTIFVVVIVGLYLWVTAVMRKRKEHDEERQRRLDAETLRQLHNHGEFNYTPGETIPREFRSGVQQKKS